MNCKNCEYYTWTTCYILGIEPVQKEDKDNIRYCIHYKECKVDIPGALSIADESGKLSIVEKDDTGRLSVV